MENYEWKYDYGGIYFYWCLGFLTRENKIDFLKKAKERLARNIRGKKKNVTSESYIFLLDNVAPEGTPEIILKKQRWRTKEY